MTVIGLFGVDGFPITFGDVLISSSVRLDKKLSVPSRGNRNFPHSEDANLHINSLRQKVNVLGKGIIAAWAGDMLQARNALKELQQIAGSGIIAEGEIERTVLSIPAGDRDNLSLIVLFRTAQAVSCYHYKAKVHDGHPSIRPVIIAGSGSDRILKIIDQLPDLQAVNVGTPPAVCAIGTFLTIVAEAYGWEVRYGANLSDYWGGAFEAATFTDVGALKISSILYVFLNIRKTNRKTLAIGVDGRIIKASYDDEDLVLRSVTLDQTDEPGLGKIREDEFYRIPPLLSAKRNAEKVKLDLKAQNICIHLQAIVDGKPTSSYPFVEFQGDREPELQLYERDGHVQVSPSASFIDKIQKRIKELPPSGW